MSNRSTLVRIWNADLERLSRRYNNNKNPERFHMLLERIDILESINRPVPMKLWKGK